MALYRVYSAPVLHKFYANVISKATLFQVLLYALMILPPFFIAYATNDLWQYTSTYREQPYTTFSGRYIVRLGDSSPERSRVWSSFPNLNQLLEPEEVAIPTLRFHEDDRNNDGKNDVLLLDMEFSSLASTEWSGVSAVEFLIFLELKLNLFSSVTFPSLVHVSESSSAGARQLWVGGELQLRQTVPLPSSGRVEDYSTPIFDYNATRAKDFETTAILSAYMERNVSAVLSNCHAVWQRAVGTDNFTLQLQLLYPTQTITYLPGFWQLLKFAWIQYLALLVIFWRVLSIAQSFVFHNGIVRTVQTHQPRTKHHAF